MPSSATSHKPLLTGVETKDLSHGASTNQPRTASGCTEPPRAGPAPARRGRPRPRPGPGASPWQRPEPRPRRNGGAARASRERRSRRRRRTWPVPSVQRGSGGRHGAPVRRPAGPPPLLGNAACSRPAGPGQARFG